MAKKPIAIKYNLKLSLGYYRDNYMTTSMRVKARPNGDEQTYRSDKHI